MASRPRKGETLDQYRARRREEARRYRAQPGVTARENNLARTRYTVPEIGEKKRAAVKLRRLKPEVRKKEQAAQAAYRASNEGSSKKRQWAVAYNSRDDVRKRNSDRARLRRHGPSTRQRVLAYHRGYQKRYYHDPARHAVLLIRNRDQKRGSYWRNKEEAMELEAIQLALRMVGNSQMKEHL
jgi:hypothetical protein